MAWDSEPEAILRHNIFLHARGKDSQHELEAFRFLTTVCLVDNPRAIRNRYRGIFSLARDAAQTFALVDHRLIEDDSLTSDHDVGLDGSRIVCCRGHERLRVGFVVQLHQSIGGDRQQELRRALGALEEDPTQLDSLLKLTQKVIFESDDVIYDAFARHKTQPKSEQLQASTSPESLAVDAAGRHARKRKKSLASGDILVLLDALIYRLGQGLPHRMPSGDLRERDIDSPEQKETGQQEPPPPPPYETLAKTCRNKVRGLIRRMNKQLELARSGSARRAIVQLAAVLSVVHTLRTMEQRIEWRSKHLKLVDPDHLWELFESAGLAVGWNNNAIAQRALQEGDQQPFQELSLALGLLAWLGWDLEIDVRAAVERKTPIDPEEEDDPWYPIQVLATVTAQLAGDQDAREILSDAVMRTPRRGSDAASWLGTHALLADRITRVIAKPERFAKSRQAPRPGDLVILDVQYDPRVRVALEVAPSGQTSKITVLDQESTDDERHFLATHVNYVPWWWREEISPMRIAASR